MLRRLVSGGKVIRLVQMPSRIALAVVSCVLLVVAGVTGLVLGGSAPAPVPVPLFTEPPPAATAPLPPVVGDIIAPAPLLPAAAKQAERPAVLAARTSAWTTIRPTAGSSAMSSGGGATSDKARGRGASASSGGESQAKRSKGDGSRVSRAKDNGKGKKPKSSHGNKGGRKG
jgi:hypothetical protein